jgi:hypothetical protein
MAKSPNRFVPSGKLKALELREGSGIGVSNLLSGRIRYNEVNNQIEYSKNGGVWATLDSGLVVYRLSADAAVVELSADGNVPGVGNRILIPADTAWDFIIQGLSRCTAGTDINTSASWYQTGTISNTGGTTALDFAVFNLLNTGLFSAAAYTPKGATGGDVGLLAMTLVPAADNANSCFAVSFTGHVGASANTFLTTAGVHMLRVG